MTAVLQLAGVHKAVPLPDGTQLPILRGVDLAIQPATTTSIMGRSGSGKSTLLSLMGLLATPTGGAVQIEGEDVTGLPDRRRAGLRNQALGFIFQNYSLIPTWTVFQNCAVPLLYRTGLSRRAIRLRVTEQLGMLGMADRLDAYPAQLSGGEQQRVAIGRALVHRPAVVLADEPTGALDEATADLVLGLLFEAVVATRAALVVVTHDDRVAARADVNLRLQAGTVTPW